jgi:hypothetical protein
MARRVPPLFDAAGRAEHGRGAPSAVADPMTSAVWPLSLRRRCLRLVCAKAPSASTG